MQYSPVLRRLHATMEIQIVLMLLASVSLCCSAATESRRQPVGFYSARNARIASAVLATAIPSVRPSVRLSVCLSVRHTPVLCQNDGT